jgi:protease PrsW
MLLLVTAIVFGLLPGFAWLAFYLGEETHAEPKRLIAFTFIAGMAFGFFTVGIETFFNRWASSVGIQELSFLSLLGLAAIEETMKFAAANFAARKSPAFNEPTDAMIYMIVAALGFAALENIGAVANLSAQGMPLLAAAAETISLRFVGATLLHTLTSGIVGYEWALGMVKGRTAEFTVGGIVIAAILHAAFNSLILNVGDIAYSVVFLLIVGFFVLNDFEKLKVEHINLLS